MNLLIALALSSRLIGGQIVDPPPHEILQLYKNGSTWCTASLVGPRSIITASHCASGQITFQSGGKTIKASMKRHPKYSTIGHQWDVALGTLDQDVPGPYASLADHVAVGDQVVLSGYGCWKNGKYDGKLRMGKADITGKAGTDWTTAKGSALCYGDSGGPAFTLQGEQFAVNSKGNISTKSWLSDLTSDGVRSWLAKESEKQGAPICGITAECR